jgi:hypothetical protein
MSKFDFLPPPTEVTLADQEEVSGMKRENESRIRSHPILTAPPCGATIICSMH